MLKNMHTLIVLTHAAVKGVFHYYMLKPCMEYLCNVNVKTRRSVDRTDNKDKLWSKE